MYRAPCGMQSLGIITRRVLAYGAARLDHGTVDGVQDLFCAASQVFSR